MDFELHGTGPDLFRLVGELDAVSAPRFERLVREREADRRRLVLDVSELVLMDSSGLRSLIRLARSHGEGVVVRNPQPAVRRALWLTGLGEDSNLGIRVEDDRPEPSAEPEGSDFLRA